MGSDWDGSGEFHHDGRVEGRQCHSRSRAIPEYVDLIDFLNDDAAVAAEELLPGSALATADSRGEFLSAENAVEQKEHERPRCGQNKAEGADGRDFAVGIEEGHDTAADDAAGNPHQDGGQRISRVAARHDCLRRQTSQRSESHPQQDFMRGLRSNGREIGVNHGDVLSGGAGEGTRRIRSVKARG